MAKNNRKFNDLEDSYYEERTFHDELKQRRKIKRMKNALKTRNIDVLLDIDEDY
jgi:hypothetical protein